MSRNLLHLLLFLAGLAAVCWVGAGYLHANPPGSAMAALIGACYLAGTLELHRYRRATATLRDAVTALSTAPSSLADWLQRLDPGLRQPVRLRIEGERVALPAPTLTPYLVGLLVLLGMLGTLLGMMATLKGTGLALDGANDLQAIRGSLAAPVAGLGFAFGTSIAGVASSAMLGLLSALCRAERLQQVQRLDGATATTLRVHSQAHQREQAFALLQRQAEAMPALLDRLQSMMGAVEQHSLAASERLHAGQQAFHASTEASYARLASSVERSLRDSVAGAARAAGAAIEPVVASTMAGIAGETAVLHERVNQAVQRQLEGLCAGFEASAATVGGLWHEAVAGQRQANEAQAQGLASALARFAETFEQRSAALLDGVATRLDTAADAAACAWSEALSRQQAHNQALIERNQQAVAASHAGFESQSTALLRALQQSHTELQAVLEQRDRERLARWSEQLATLAAALGEQWRQAGEQALGRQQEICDTLARTAGEISASTRAHASGTIAEMSRLVDAAAEAPRAAAEIVAELRQKLSESMLRDTAMLDERSRLLATLETLLDAVNHASTGQRSAVDALVTTSAELLDRVGTRFAGQVESGANRLGAVAAQVTASAIEVASLGEAFAAGVELFGRSNDALMERLQHIAAALDASLVRSDEQLAYYVAQAREVIDLSMLSQQQIVGDLQRLAGQRAGAVVEAA